jgi:hypothetical protein
LLLLEPFCKTLATERCLNAILYKVAFPGTKPNKFLSLFIKTLSAEK